MEAFCKAAEVLTPRTLDEFERLQPLPRDELGEVMEAVRSGAPFAAVVVGPFGSGKTTLARLLTEGFATATWIDSENVQAIVENGLPDHGLQDRVFLIDDADIFYYVSARVRDMLSEFLTFHGARLGLILTWSCCVEPRVEDELWARLRNPRVIRLSGSHRLGAAAEQLRAAGPPSSDLAERLENHPGGGTTIREALHKMMFSKELATNGREDSEEDEEDKEAEHKDAMMRNLEARVVSLEVDKKSLRKSRDSWESVVRSHEALLTFRSRSCKCYGTDENLKSLCDKMINLICINYDCIHTPDCKKNIYKPSAAAGQQYRVNLSSESGAKNTKAELVAWLCKDAGIKR